MLIIFEKEGVTINSKLLAGIEMVDRDEACGYNADEGLILFHTNAEDPFQITYKDRVIRDRIYVEIIKNWAIDYDTCVITADHVVQTGVIG